MVLSYYDSARSNSIQGFLWDWVATDINNVMYAYIDTEKELTWTNAFKSYWLWKFDKDIFRQFFNIADEIKVSKQVKESIGRNSLLEFKKLG